MYGRPGERVTEMEEITSVPCPNGVLFRSELKITMWNGQAHEVKIPGNAFKCVDPKYGINGPRCPQDSVGIFFLVVL